MARYEICDVCGIGRTPSVTSRPDAGKRATRWRNTAPP